MIDMNNFTLVLSTRSLEHRGQLHNISNLIVKQNMNSADELSFTIHKSDNMALWSQIIDLRLVWLKELNEYFEISVTINEELEVTKSIVGTSLCEAELSQTKLYNIEINTEADIERDKYIPTKFYDPDKPDGSLLHRIINKVPHYSIGHVDSSLKNLQRTFSANDITVYDFLVNTVAQELHCLFLFDSATRTISVYDLETVCEDCGFRGDYMDVCPKCGSHNLKYYGEDTAIKVSVNNLTDSIIYETNKDSIKNCFRLEAGDDDLTSAVISCNPNGSSYIYYFSEEQLSDMPDELVNKINSYNELYKQHEENYVDLSINIYDCIDKILYYRSGMMPLIDQTEVTVSTEAAKLTAQNLSPLALATLTPNTSVDTINSALLSYAKSFVKTGYVRLQINKSDYNANLKKWAGNFKVTNYSDEEDIAYSEEIMIDITDDYETFISEKIMKQICSNDKEDYIYNVLQITDLDDFKNALTYYCYNRLESFADAIQGVIDTLIELHQSNADASYYNQFYLPYFKKLEACQEEMNIRSATIEEYESNYDSLIKKRTEIQDILDFEKYLGEDLFKIFCAYRREDTYKNENYISDGLSTSELFERAMEFIEIAKKEIVKSGEYQHTISSTLYNLTKIPEFKPLLNKFALGNWIRFEVQNNIYRLRLISYEYNSEKKNDIITEFSDLTKTANGMNDIHSILNSAKSMSANYTYVARQANKGKDAYDQYTNWNEVGLNSALVKIKNSDNAQITMDKHGLMCRAYDDISETYSPKQLKLINNEIVMTEDNWETASLAIGEHHYVYYDSNNDCLSSGEGYGVSAKFLNAPYIYGGQILGADIYSVNYSTNGKSGSHINLQDGTFSLGGGKIKYDGDNLTLSEVVLRWEDVTDAPTTLSYFDNDTGFQNASQVTTITKNTVTTEYINALKVVAGSVRAEDITGDTISGKTFIVGGENSDGQIIIKDAEGTIIGTIGVDGFKIKSSALITTDGDDVIKGRSIDREKAPSLIEYGGGFDNYGSTAESGIGYVGGNGHTNDGDPNHAKFNKWGVDTEEINVTTFNTLKLSSYVHMWGDSTPQVYLRIYCDGVLVYNYDDADNSSVGNLYKKESDDSCNKNPIDKLLEFDISSYSTIRIKLLSEGSDTNKAWVYVGLTSLYLC